jgi:hypothetical protein
MICRHSALAACHHSRAPPVVVSQAAPLAGPHCATHITVVRILCMAAK